MTSVRTQFDGRKVDAWCAAAGMQHAELAGVIGADPRALEAWISERRVIDFSSACAIANAFGRPVGELRKRRVAA